MSLTIECIMMLSKYNTQGGILDDYLLFLPTNFLLKEYPPLPSCPDQWALIKAGSFSTYYDNILISNIIKEGVKMILFSIYRH